MDIFRAKIRVGTQYLQVTDGRCGLSDQPTWFYFLTQGQLAKEFLVINQLYRVGVMNEGKFVPLSSFMTTTQDKDSFFLGFICPRATTIYDNHAYYFMVGESNTSLWSYPLTQVTIIPEQGEEVTRPGPEIINEKLVNQLAVRYRYQASLEQIWYLSFCFFLIFLLIIVAIEFL
ncbi:MAG: hypothetical protein ACYCQJ_14195 [Nitrososphaerales archaeon]